MTSKAHFTRKACTGLTQVLAVLTVVILTGFLSITPSAAQSVQRVIATVNDDPITAYDLNQRVRFTMLTSRIRGSAKLKQAILKALVNERLQMQAAKRLGITIGDEEVNATLSGLAKRNRISLKRLKAVLKSRGVRAKTLEEKIRAELAWREVIRRKFRRLVSVGNSDIELELTRAGKNGKSKKGGKDKGGNKAPADDAGARFELMKFLLQFTQGRTQSEVKSRMQEAVRFRAAFKTCKRSKTLARRLHAVKTTHIKSITDNKLKEPVRSLLLKTPAGKMTPPSLAANGVELIAVCNRYDSKNKGDTLRKSVEQKLRNQEFGRFSQQYLRDLRRDAIIEFRTGKKKSRKKS
jgi:peptidyl-prolyl cis-trans isomerase SurA